MSGELGDGTLVLGYVKSSVPPRISPRTIVTLGVMTHLEPYVEEFRWKVNFPVLNEGNRESSAEGHGVFHLPPGAYDGIVVAADSTMVITSGQYFVESLGVREDGVLEI